LHSLVLLLLLLHGRNRRGLLRAEQPAQACKGIRPRVVLPGRQLRQQLLRLQCHTSAHLLPCLGPTCGSR
jgi:hypothetical protein